MEDQREQQEQKFWEMTQAPVGRLVGRLAFPCIISMLVTAFYNMADTFFVGMMDSNAATGAVGVVFSMMAIIQAVGFFFGHGSGNFISRELGKHHYEEASNMAATGFFSALAAGALICLAGQIFLTPLASLLGSTETILPYAREYLRVILLGAPWMTASLVLNNQLRFQGSAAYAMVGITSGAVLNIGLDPLLIFVLDMGVASVATICLNHAAGPYGDAAIAAMSVVQRITTFGASAMIGFGQGFQPVCGFNFGARLYRRVREGFFFCVKTATVFLLAMSILGFIFAPQLISLFRDDPEVIRYGTSALRFQCVTFCLQGWVVMSNMMLQTIGRTVPATFLAMARQGVFFVPLVWILSHTLGMLGVQLAQPVSDLCTILCAIPIQCRVLGEMARAPEAN